MSPALQVDSLPAELPGKPSNVYISMQFSQFIPVSSSLTVNRMILRKKKEKLELLVMKYFRLIYNPSLEVQGEAKSVMF